MAVITEGRAAELPVGVESAAWRLDAAVGRDLRARGVPDAVVSVQAAGDGKPTVTVHSKGRPRMLTFLDGAWHEVRVPA